jgi:peptide-methionine (S)-S-oxide reductase
MFKLTKRNSGTVAAASAPPARAGEQRSGGAQRATFAAGCFWGVEAAFREVEGVVNTRVGYTGGRTTDPTYDQVCRRHTGHAEAVEVWFDPSQVSYEQLLHTFWRIHNPTTRNRQGLDFGSQYRSAIFVYDVEQDEFAASSRAHEQQSRRKPIVTEITPAGPFFEAEDYHQQYFEKQGRGMRAATIR